MSIAQAHSEFGSVLRQWRARRRLSQLDLALEAGVSARHVCFLENGRAQPSREMVVQLANALDVPLEARNALLNAAGYAPLYRARPAEDDALKLPLAALDWMLERHAPYPGFALDRAWRVVRANAPAERMLAAAGGKVGDSLLEACRPGGRLRALIVNWPLVGRYFAARLRTEIAHYGGDPILEEGLEGLMAETPAASAGSIPAVLPVTYQLGPARLSFISTIAHFGGAEDIALGDLRIELLFPADEATRQALSG